ncbi:hypothetical protein FA95DRAFT_1619274, partial [Auriscalpium vulgare]
NAAAVHHYADLVSEDTEKAADASDQPADRAPQSIVISGSELDMVTTHAVMDRLCAYEEIMVARTTPKRKLRIVQAFQARDSIVAMTGDGVNDAPRSAWRTAASRWAAGQTSRGRRWAWCCLRPSRPLFWRWSTA